MTSVYEHNPGDHEDPVPSSTWMVGIVGVIVLLVTIFGLTALLYRASGDELQEKVISRSFEEVGDLRESQEKLLHHEAGWIKRDIPGTEGKEQEDVFVIPIESAMELVIQEARVARQEEQ